LLRRRNRPSHAKVRSTTQRRGTTANAATTGAARAELVNIWARRGDVPAHLWDELLRGDPEGRQLAARDDEQAIGHGVVAGRVAAVLGAYQPLAEVATIRLHDTPLYNSIYRFDDALLVNVHVYGLLAAHTPTLHLRRVDGAYFHTYVESFERVWSSARPWVVEPALEPA
jgi:hypothetical protein